MSARRISLAAIAIAALLAVAGCGSSSSGVQGITVGAARTFQLAGFQPSTTVPAGRPVPITFTVQQPSGKPLTAYKTGGGPHTGVHLIIVRDDLAYIIHHHPPVGAGGMLHDTVTFPAPGPYRVLVDVYPNIPGGQPNFQLLKSITVAGAYHPRSLPAFKAHQVVDGYHFDMAGGAPSLHAIQAAFVNIDVTDPQGHKVTFVPWYGALAHAIFFHKGSLDYFHTHVCGAGAPNCTSVLGATRVSGSSTAPGKLTLGILLPVPGTWELFLQALVGGHVVTVPYTLKVS
jgi:hypothetical protein